MSEAGGSAQTFHQALQLARESASNSAGSLALFDRLLMAYPDAVAATVERARAREAAQNWDGAVEDYTRALEVMPDDGAMMTSLARCHMRAGNEIEGRFAALQALDHDPDDRDAYMFVRMSGEEVDVAQIGELARISEGYLSGQTQRAITEMKAFARKDPDRADAQVLLARMLWQSGRHIAAMDVCERILDRAPDCLFAYVFLHQFWLMARNQGQAEVYRAEVERLDPDHRVSAAAFGALAAHLPVKDAPAQPPIRQKAYYPQDETPAASDQDHEAWVDELAASSSLMRTKVPPVFGEEEGPIANYFPLDWEPVAEAKQAAQETGEASRDLALAQPIPKNEPEGAAASEQAQSVPLADEPVEDEQASAVLANSYNEWLSEGQLPAEIVAPPAPKPRLVTPRPRRQAARLEVMPSPQKKASENLRAAREEMAKGNYALALKQIELVVNKGKKPRETVTQIEELIERLNPRVQKALLSEAYQLLAIAYTQAGRPDDALEALQRK